MNNKHGPHLWFTATRGDPDIGRLKRGRAPCPSTLITLLIKRKAGVADGLDANAMAGIKAPEWVSYVNEVWSSKFEPHPNGQINKKLLQRHQSTKLLKVLIVNYISLMKLSVLASWWQNILFGGNFGLKFCKVANISFDDHSRFYIQTENYG